MSEDLSFQEIENYVQYISDYENQFENQRQNCTNCYSDIKSLITELEMEYPKIDINIFSDFFQIIEEFFQFFSSSKDVLNKFSYLNDYTQELNTKYNRAVDLVNGYKEMYENLNEEMKIKENNIINLKDEITKLNKNYIELYQKYDISNNEKLRTNIIEENTQKNLIEKIKKLTDEKLELENKINIYESLMKSKYVLKTEYEKLFVNSKKEKKKNEELIESLTIENENLKAENNKLTTLKYELEGQLNKKIEEIDKIINQTNNNEMTEDNKNDTIKDVTTLENLLALDEEEQNQNNIPVNILNINNQKLNNNNLDNINTNITEKRKSLSFLSPRENNTMLSHRSNIESNTNLNFRVSGNLLSERASFFDIKENNPIDENVNIYDTYRDSQRSTFTLNRPKISGIKNAYKMIKKNPAKKYNEDYYKQFFFLLFQAMKLNSESIEAFLVVDPENLYYQCKKEHIPFHKYEKWLNEHIESNIDNNVLRNNQDYVNLVTFISNKLF